jgi:8-oxo-dGTP pyrophosphatase MutT (NUDIX family)
LRRGEASAVAETIAFVEAHPDCLLRSCAPGHLTGSAWIVSPDRRRTLLTLHRKLGKWLQLGGHADGDPDLLAVALREAREESGLARLAVVGARAFRRRPPLDTRGAGTSRGTGTTTSGSCSRPTHRRR